MKKLAIVIVTFFCFIMFSGCAKCIYSVQYMSNGEIVQTFSTSIDKQKLQQAQFSYDKLSEMINNIYVNYWANKQSSMLANLNNNENLTAVQRSELFNSVKGEIKNSTQSIDLIISYPSSKVANLVNTDPNQMTDNQQSNSTEIKETAFTITQIQTLDNAFVGIEEADLYQQLKDVYCSNGAFNQSDLELQHVIAFSSKRYKSNADYITNNGELTYHIWDLNTIPNQNGEIENEKLQIYVTQAKPLAWYLLALVITSVFILSSCLIVFIKQKTTKKV